ncbi:MAG: hypothetical protein LBD05_02905 [Mycoplasmataceae bacterium]|jgi:aspartyl-tRNA(Asn)/glutamyl-tRNA(Gln) amidotransferase subunit C|nr:hypothetical protein [Mycoplasmataceae bacterium]
MSNKIDKSKIKEIANDLLFEIDNEQLKHLDLELPIIISSFNLLNKFNLKNVEPTDFPIKLNHHKLRIDQETEEK